MPNRTYVIAEAGVNHNGSLEMALELIDAAAAAGADAVKFQTFKADRLVTKGAQKAAYQKQTTGIAESQCEMLTKLELTHEMHLALMARCRERAVEFLSTPFDPIILQYLVDVLGLRRIKLSSGEVTNGPFLLEAIRRSDHLILSTGMSSLGEVEEAIKVLGWGIEDESSSPSSRLELNSYWPSNTVMEVLRERVILLHCTTEYPAAYAETNLRAMDTMRDLWGIPVGFSDHTPGITIPLAAIALGAEVIEKHITLDRGLPGPDHAASLEPSEFKSMIVGIRAVEDALGDGIKRPSTAEFANRTLVRKGLHAARAIPYGEILSTSNVAIKRPGSGLSPMAYWDVLGSVASRTYQEDEPISSSWTTGVP
jgi:N-acetylneuraminate synthase